MRFKFSLKNFILLAISLVVFLPFSNCSLGIFKSQGSISGLELASLTTPTALTCASTDNLLKPQMKRLTLKQYKNSIEATFGTIFTDSQFPNFNDSNPRLGLSNDPEILQINEVNINALFDSTKLIIGSILTQNTEVKNCVNSSNDNCILSLAQTLGQKLWRRPLSNSDFNDLSSGLLEVSSAGGSKQNKIEFLLSSLIISSNHLFRTEIGELLASNSALTQLTQYEIASLLSFNVWDTPPDDILYKLAASNQLKTVTDLKAQINRMVLDPKFANKISDFTVDLLKIENIKTTTKDPSYNFTAADRLALYNSALATLKQVFEGPKVDFFAPYSITQFNVNNLSAKYFNLQSNNLTSNFESVALNANERYGMLSHPAFLGSIAGQIESGIVRRGVFAIEQLLCNHLAPPPANIMGVTNLPPGFDSNLVSSREALRITHSSQTSCLGCHNQIDPAGFGFENYNALGQYRTTEKTNIPIDSSGSITGLAETRLVFSDSVGYFKELTQSQKFKKCLTQKFFQYSLGQSVENSMAAKCEFNNYQSKISAKDNSTLSYLLSFVELDSFTLRKASSK